jgi:hypothetical protein
MGNLYFSTVLRDFYLHAGVSSAGDITMADKRRWLPLAGLLLAGILPFCVLSGCGGGSMATSSSGGSGGGGGGSGGGAGQAKPTLVGLVTMGSESFFNGSSLPQNRLLKANTTATGDGVANISLSELQQWAAAIKAANPQ